VRSTPSRNRRSRSPLTSCAAHDGVIVTHRFSTVRNADVIHFLEHGCLVESGSWDERSQRAVDSPEMQDKQSLA